MPGIPLTNMAWSEQLQAINFNGLNLYYRRMSDTLVATTSILINAPVTSVWDALTTPEIIKKYLFGTNVTSDWTVGSAITYSGEWEGKQYEDKGVILQLIPVKLFESTYWSPLSGVADIPENYNKVTYELATENSQTRLTVTQDNVRDEAALAQSTKNWDSVLHGLKDLLEKR